VRAATRWLVWGALVAVLGVFVVWGLDALFGHDENPWLGALAGLVSIVPFALAIRSARIARAAGPALVATLSFAALLAIVAGAYALVVLLAGRRPTDAERWFLGIAMIVVVIAALAYHLLESRIDAWARRLVYRDRSPSADLSRTFSARMSRAIPLDELALQSAEQLRGSLGLRAVELWTLHGATLRPWIGEPEIDRPPIDLGSLEPVVVVQAGLSGHGWLSVWLPQMLEGREDAYVRLAPMAHAGELLGTLVIERPVTATTFSADDERTLVEIARQLGVVLHNARLDSALEESLQEVRRQADELQASRGRIVAAGDTARRMIERNLHDGAQQHVVALGIQVKLARTLMEKDPARATEVLDGLSAAVDDTLQELRDLAHGIYPPLLADRGLPDALAAAARRSVLPVTVRTDGLGRYAPEAEATVYFCVLEALQNAGKYAGEGAAATVTVEARDPGLTFVVKDDGAGFDTRDKGMGAGFQNMLDRLGALGGTLRVESAPGRGTQVTGALPATPVEGAPS
jgi:signal transduction histidine kinase